MARPQKEGLEYFPIVTAFDEKVELIIAEFGPEGLGIIIGLFQRIYSNGYYMNWNEDTLMLFASKHINAEKTRVNAVLMKCLERNIFSKDLYRKYGILTSRGIQKQYLKVCKDSRRKSVQFVKEYCLVDDAELTRVITELTGVNAEETPENDVLGTQSKVKESKVKESKVKKSKVNKETSDENNPVDNVDNVDNNFKMIIEAFNKNIHIASPVEIEKLQDWIKDMEYEVIIYAIGEAVTYNKRSLAYINAVLNDWLEQNITTKEAVEAHLGDKADKKSNAQGKKHKNGFNDYDQRTYNIKELEKKLLGRDDSEGDSNDYS